MIVSKLIEFLRISDCPASCVIPNDGASQPSEGSPRNFALCSGKSLAPLGRFFDEAQLRSVMTPRI
jgi:hypothetical protein